MLVGGFVVRRQEEQSDAILSGPMYAGAPVHTAPPEQMAPSAQMAPPMQNLGPSYDTEPQGYDAPPPGYSQSIVNARPPAHAPFATQAPHPIYNAQLSSYGPRQIRNQPPVDNATQSRIQAFFKHLEQSIPEENRWIANAIAREGGCGPQPRSNAQGPRHGLDYADRHNPDVPISPIEQPSSPAPQADNPYSSSSQVAGPPTKRSESPSPSTTSDPLASVETSAQILSDAIPASVPTQWPLSSLDPVSGGPANADPSPTNNFNCKPTSVLEAGMDVDISSTTQIPNDLGPSSRTHSEILRVPIPTLLYEIQFPESNLRNDGQGKSKGKETMKAVEMQRMDFEGVLKREQVHDKVVHDALKESEVEWNTEAENTLALDILSAVAAAATPIPVPVKTEDPFSAAASAALEPPTKIENSDCPPSIDTALTLISSENNTIGLPTVSEPVADSASMIDEILPTNASAVGNPLSQQTSNGTQNSISSDLSESKSPAGSASMIDDVTLANADPDKSLGSSLSPLTPNGTKASNSSSSSSSDPEPATDSASMMGVVTPNPTPASPSPSADAETVGHPLSKQTSDKSHVSISSTSSESEPTMAEGEMDLADQMVLDGAGGGFEEAVDMVMDIAVEGAVWGVLDEVEE